MLLELGMRKPLNAVRHDLELVIKNQPPSHSTAELLELLHLNGREIDNKSLAQRLFGHTTLDQIYLPTKKDLYSLLMTVGLTGQLLNRLSEMCENANELAFAKTLIIVAERQILREGDMCPLATKLYLTAGQSRLDLVDQSIYNKLLVDLPREKESKVVYHSEVL